MSEREYKERYLRLAAEFENYKKRQEKEIEKIKKNIAKEIMKEALPVNDSLIKLMMLFYGDNLTIDMLAEAVDATLSLMDDFLDVNDVRPFRALGKKFDPNYHEALGSRITKHPKDIIIDVFREGYMIGDSLLRPADVMLSRKDG